MQEIRDAPGQFHFRQFRRKFLMPHAPSRLDGFLRQQQGIEHAICLAPQSLPHLLQHLRRVHIPGDHEKGAIRNIPLLIIAKGLVPRHLIKQLQAANDRFAIRMMLINGGEKQLAERAPRIILSHVHFPADDIFLPLVFVLRKGRLGDQGSDDVQRRGKALLEGIHPVNGAIKRRIGIQISTGRLHCLRQFRRTPSSRAFEDQMLHQMRHARPQQFRLIQTARPHPRLNTHQLRPRRLLHDHLQPILQSVECGIGQGKRKIGGSHATVRTPSASNLKRNLKDCSRVGRSRGCGESVR